MNHNQIVGEFGEKIAINYLKKNGYLILDTNIKTSYKELDIVAKHQGIIVFIEVKTRTSNKFGTADEGAGHKKIANLKRAIEFYLEKNRIEEENIRLDLIAIDIDKYKNLAKIKHYKDIF